MEIKDMVGLAAAIITALGFLPKVIKVWKTHSAEDMPWWLLFLFALDVVLWFAYGYLAGSQPTMVASLIIGAFIAEISMVKLKYG